MRRPALLILLAVVVAALLGLLALGAFPPRPHLQPVQHTLPNDRFATPPPSPPSPQ